MRIFFSLTLLICSALAFQPQTLWANRNSKSSADFQQAEDSLNVLAKEMFTSIVPNGKMDAGFAFAKLLYKTLQEPGSFNYQFDSLGKQIRVLSSEDKSFRIFNWLVSPEQNTVRYYGIIQTPDGLFPLVNFADRLIESKTLETDILDKKHWFGAEYYKIKTEKADGKKYYFLFGLNSDGIYSNKKLLDVLTFGDNGPVFGAPVFQFPSESGTLQTQTRIVWQYKKTASFSLDFDTERNIIAFDDLHSRISNPLRKDTYVPTGRIDGLKWQNGHWVYIENVITPMKLRDGQAPINGVIQK